MLQSVLSFTTYNVMFIRKCYLFLNKFISIKFSNINHNLKMKPQTSPDTAHSLAAQRHGIGFSCICLALNTKRVRHLEPCCQNNIIISNIFLMNYMFRCQTATFRTKCRLQTLTSKFFFNTLPFNIKQNSACTQFSNRSIELLCMLCIFYCFSILLGVVIHLDPGCLNFVMYGMTIHCHMRMTM